MAKNLIMSSIVDSRYLNTKFWTNLMNEKTDVQIVEQE
jgi:hypothetical protein